MKATLHPLHPGNRVQKSFQLRRERLIHGGLTPKRKLKKMLATLDKKEKAALEKACHPGNTITVIGGIAFVNAPRKVTPNGCHVVCRISDDHHSEHVSRVGDRRRIGPRQRLEKLPKLNPRQVDALERAIESEISGKTGDLTVEATAIRHRTHPKHVQEVFRRLNRKGLLSQKRREFGHDTNRAPMFYGSDSGWAANRYHILNHDENETVSIPS